jgi:hypothetical protein
MIGLLPHHLLYCSTALLLCRPFFNGLLGLPGIVRTGVLVRVLVIVLEAWWSITSTSTARG